MPSKVLAIGVMAAVLAINGVVQATPIYIATTGVDYSTLLGGSATPIGLPLTTDFSGGNFFGKVVSQAFTDGAGHYLYLYQIDNTGTPNSDVATRFTASPFTGADALISLGYLNANIPAPFVFGNQAPLYADVISVPAQRSGSTSRWAIQSTTCPIHLSFQAKAAWCCMSRAI